MYSRQQITVLAACLYLVPSIFAGVLSKDLIRNVEEVSTAHFAEYQETKTFTIDANGALVAIDDNGSDPVDILVTPKLGESLEFLHMDKDADQILYKATTSIGERAGKVGLFGENPQNIVPEANQITFSSAHGKLYWTRNDAIRSINLDGTGHTVLAKQEGQDTNDVTGWAWLGSYPWTYSPSNDDWCYFHGDIWVYHQSNDQWSKGLQDAGINGWTWWGAYPWIYVNGYASWVYVDGDLWTYFNKTAAWDLLENTSAPTFDGVPTAIHVDTTLNELYFQLNPPVLSNRSFGSIEKLNLSNGQISPVMEMTNATHIQSLASSDRIYWAESDGLHTAILSGEDRAHIMTTPAQGAAAPVVYEEPAPMLPGTPYQAKLTPHTPQTQINDLQLDGTTQIFNLGYGRDFLSGNFSWFRRPGGRQVVITLTIGEPVTAFPEELGLPYAGRNVDEIYLNSGGAKDLPKSITLTLSYRENHSGTYVENRYLASQETETVTGDFSGWVGDYTNVARPTITPPNYEGATISSLSAGADGNLEVRILNSWGGVNTLGFDVTNNATLLE